MVDGRKLESAREAAARLAETNPLGCFTQRMKESLRFFHPDKRDYDKESSKDEKSEQFSRAKEAWECLAACRARFHELRVYRARVGEVAEAE